MKTTAPFLLQANALHIPLADESVSMVVTSPPYFGLRDYGTAKWDGGRVDCDHRHQLGGEGEKSAMQNASTGSQTIRYKTKCKKCGAHRIDNQIGLEATPEEFIAAMVAVFREVWRVLHPSGTVWLNLGDTYAGSGGAGGDYAEGGLKAGQPKYKSNMEIDRSKSRESKRWGGGNSPATGHYKPKDLMMIPARVAIALWLDGWWVRKEIIWYKPNPMPSSAKDRPTSSHEKIYLLSKRARYFYDAEAVRECGKMHGGLAGTFSRDNGKNTTSSVPGQSKPSHRPDRNDRVPSGRNRRDVWEQDNTPREFEKYCAAQGVDLGALMDGFDAGQDIRKDVWKMATRGFPGAHFATFPPELPRICIKAGTSEKGNCPDCGSPWERVVEKTGGLLGKSWHDHSDDLTKGQRKYGDDSSYSVKTIGWQPTCTCGNPDTVPATVFDPFAGAATTGLVARELGRRSVMIDLSPEYIKLQKERLGITALKEWREGKPTPAAAKLDDLPLFRKE